MTLLVTKLARFVENTKDLDHRFFIDTKQTSESVENFLGRNGDISVIEFCKSIDIVYREMWKVRARIANESRMNAASEQILNIVFYFFLCWIGVNLFQYNSTAVIDIVATFVIAISFLSSEASGSFVKGFLLILVQRMYDIGGRIIVNEVGQEPSQLGSSGWFVKDLNITQEYATCASGSLASSRIINAARSPRTQLQFEIMFGKNVSKDKLEEFRISLEDLIRSTPREWLTLKTFRLNSTNADDGYVEYKVILQHTESGQNYMALQDSLADIQVKTENFSERMEIDFRGTARRVS